jgi:hypothetical protein
MEAHTPARPGPARGTAGRARRLTTETKQAFKTTEFWAYVVVALAVLIAGTADDAEGGAFGAGEVWLYVTLLTIGYMLARGIAKAGSRDPYWEEDGGSDPGSLGERVRSAAQVLRDGEAHTSETERL